MGRKVKRYACKSLPGRPVARQSLCSVVSGGGVHGGWSDTLRLWYSWNSDIEGVGGPEFNGNEVGPWGTVVWNVVLGMNRGYSREKIGGVGV